MSTYLIPRGLMARIAGFHPAGPGSIPGVGDEFPFGFENISFIMKSKNTAATWDRTGDL